VRFIRFCFYARIYRDPVYFPSSATVLRERLFKTARVSFDIRDNKANQNSAAVDRFLIVKLAAAILVPQPREHLLEDCSTPNDVRKFGQPSICPCDQDRCDDCHEVHPTELATVPCLA
jgi:hypothetical protein